MTKIHLIEIAKEIDIDKNRDKIHKQEYELNYESTCCDDCCYDTCHTITLATTDTKQEAENIKHELIAWAEDFEYLIKGLPKSTKLST